MKRGLIVLVFLSLILILSLTFVSAASFDNSLGNIAGQTASLDLTPRISYWYGKVNQHIDTSNGLWMTDPDGTSSASINKLTYCKKWYPGTVGVSSAILPVTINTWHSAGNVGDYTNTTTAYVCLQPSSNIQPYYNQTPVF